MLRMSKFTDYGVLVLNAMTEVGALKLSTEDLAEKTRLSVPTVRKVMKTLVDNGFVIAQRGAGGGYRLARAAGQIRMLDIVEAFEGPIMIADCAQEDYDCEIENCSLVNHWSGINKLLEQFLARVSLEDIREPERQERKIDAVLADDFFIEVRNL